MPHPSPYEIRPNKPAAIGHAPQDHIEGRETTSSAVFLRRAPLCALLPGQPIGGPTYSAGSPMIPQMQKTGAVAVIPVWGVLGKRLGPLELMCEGSDYEHLAEFAGLAAHRRQSPDSLNITPPHKRQRTL